MTSAYCSMVHSGLELHFDQNQTSAQSCCLRNSRFAIDINTDFWNNLNFVPLRQTNKQDIWAQDCENCSSLESNNNISFRQGMNQSFKGTRFDAPGPARIDLKFDISCNLACRSCGTHSSTFWQKHLKQHGQWNFPVQSDDNFKNVITALKQLDLSNLQMLVFAGGETLLGQTHWKVAQWLADNIPNAKQQLTLCFQTNGTQPIHPRNHELIEKFHLVKVHISLDGTTDKFEYLRWPASWNQVTENILSMRQLVPSNVMFLIEETISIVNFAYLTELDQWVKNNYSTNREGDIVVHSRHLANGIFQLENMTHEYVDAVLPQYQQLIPVFKKENPTEIAKMINTIKQIDQYRNQSFETTFPMVAEYYKRYLT